MASCAVKFILLLAFCLGNTLFSVATASENDSEDENSDTECADVRLDKTVMKDMPIVNQRPYGTCYAAVATQMLDAWRIKTENISPSKVSSVLDAAVLHFENFKRPKKEALIDEALKQYQMTTNNEAYVLSGAKIEKIKKNVFSQATKEVAARKSDLKGQIKFHQEEIEKNINIGWLDETFKILLSKGACPASQVDSAMSDLRSEDYLEKQQALWREVIRAENLKKLGVSRSICEISTVPAKMDSLANLALEWAEVDYQKIKKTTEHLCEGKRESPKLPPKLSYFDFSKSDNKKKLETLNQEFKSTGLPLGLHLCGEVLWDSKIASEIAKKGKSERCDTNHFVLAVGTRKNANGRCEVLVRNSWGADTGKLWNSESGQLWIPADVLMNASDEIYSMVPQKN